MSKALKKIEKQIKKAGGIFVRETKHKIYRMPDGALISISRSWNSPKLPDFERWKRNRGQ